MLFQFMESDQCIDRIVPFGIGKTKKQRDISMQLTVISGKLEPGIAVIELVKVTVPSPGSIRVRKMSRSRIYITSGNSGIFAAMPPWVGMGMYRAVPSPETVRFSE